MFFKQKQSSSSEDSHLWRWWDEWGCSSFSVGVQPPTEWR